MTKSEEDSQDIYEEDKEEERAKKTRILRGEVCALRTFGASLIATADIAESLL